MLTRPAVQVAQIEHFLLLEAAAVGDRVTPEKKGGRVPDNLLTPEKSGRQPDRFTPKKGASARGGAKRQPDKT